MVTADAMMGMSYGHLQIAIGQLAGERPSRPDPAIT